MVQALLELVVAPALVGAATLAARRWDERIGGLVSAFPAIVGPVLLIAALEHGGAFAARAASGTLLGLVALSGFVVVYGATAQHAGWRGSLLAAWAAAALLGLAVTTLSPGPVMGLVAACVSLAAAYCALASKPRGEVVGGTMPLPAVAVAVPRWDLPARMVLTAVLVVSLSAAASRLGPVAGGILAALPVLASILAVFTHSRYGPAALADLLRGMLAGMAGFVAFCALVAVLADRAGLVMAFAIAAGAAIAVQVATARAAAARPA